MPDLPRWTQTIKPVAPYNFKALAHLYSKFPVPVMNHASYNSITRVYYNDESMALVDVRGVGGVNDAELDMALLAESGEIPENKLLSQIKFVLSTDVDHSEFFSFVRDNARLWDFMRSFYGMPMLRTATLFEALICVIIEQHIRWDTALHAQTRLLQWGGRSLHYDNKIYHAFPTVAQLANASHDDLLFLKVTHKRIDLIRDIARSIHEGEFDLEALKQQPAQVCYEQLKTIKGIGHWTASVATMRATGTMMFIPDNDVALQAATNYYFYESEARRMEKEKLLQTYESYGDYAPTLANYVLSRWVYDMY
ncbi:MAG: DNA-3-methyladenine glycosylase family protein [Aggregatilineales bacterium]